MNKGFTLIELVVVMAVVAILSGLILYSVTQYIAKGQDSNVYGNLVILIPAGEAYYNNSSYNGFCGSAVITNAITQMPENATHSCAGANSAPSNSVGLCCYVSSDGNSWAAYARKFADTSFVYCVDSRGVKKEVDYANRSSISTNFKCP